MDRPVIITHTVLPLHDPNYLCVYKRAHSAPPLIERDVNMIRASAEAMLTSIGPSQAIGPIHMSPITTGVVFYELVHSSAIARRGVLQ